jgi:hypothetical protein
MAHVRWNAGPAVELRRRQNRRSGSGGSSPADAEDVPAGRVVLDQEGEQADGEDP